VYGVLAPQKRELKDLLKSDSSTCSVTLTPYDVSVPLSSSFRLQIGPMIHNAKVKAVIKGQALIRRQGQREVSPRCSLTFGRAQPCVTPSPHEKMTPCVFIVRIAHIGDGAARKRLKYYETRPCILCPLRVEMIKVRSSCSAPWPPSSPTSFSAF